MIHKLANSTVQAVTVRPAVVCGVHRMCYLTASYMMEVEFRFNDDTMQY
jgi:hypothetical protein